MLTPFDYVAVPSSLDGFRREVRTFLDQELADLPAHVRARSWMGTSIDFSRKLAKRGWLGLTIPTSHGGAGKDFFARYVLSEELLVSGAPVAAHWIADRQSGPLIMRYGTEQQKQFYVPKICQAEAFFCIGMSEPNSGSDLASIRTRAERNADGWLLNGSKIWTTNAHHCHFMIALVRTSGQPADKHNGLSQLIVDLSKPGVTIRPITDMAGDAHFNEVFFDNVQLDADALIGMEGQGWEQCTAELAFERSGPERIYSSMVLLDAWAQELRSQDCQDADAQRLLGSLLAELCALRGMSLSVTDQLVQGFSPAVEASVVKDYGTDFEQRVIRDIGQWIGEHPEFAVSGELMKVLAYLEQMGVTFSLRGGTREILRGIIARGLALR
ncbi:acyl-CoA dehydrogenase family protein [Orrella daihaiensis]|uniref:Acyl-CoA dehydrogenase family protein n=1 Tax=Orrella daihaiensis TaxID=2782176 RepID=A0ABY4AQA8_9BURK|nr:acyl-CoA dehydrogenase family protein [Orrella daihaiensis]UOD51217.1 acyl-CoA dehydrogenase family protein [Orrella daihaiensis]